MLQVKIKSRLKFFNLRGRLILNFLCLLALVIHNLNLILTCNLYTIVLTLPNIGYALFIIHYTLFCWADKTF